MYNHIKIKMFYIFLFKYFFAWEFDLKIKKSAHVFPKSKRLSERHHD